MNNPRQIQTRRILASLLVMAALSSASAMTNDFVDEVVSPTPTAKQQHDIREEATPPAPAAKTEDSLSSEELERQNLLVQGQEKAYLTAVKFINYLPADKDVLNLMGFEHGRLEGCEMLITLPPLNRLKCVQEVNLKSLSLTSLHGLEALPNLRTLCLDSLSLKSFKALQKLSELETLELTNIKMASLKVLPSMKGLKSLTLNVPGLSLEGVEKQKTLERLIINEVDMSSVSNLAKLNKGTIVHFLRRYPEAFIRQQFFVRLTERGVMICFQQDLD